MVADGSNAHRGKKAQASWRDVQHEAVVGPAQGAGGRQNPWIRTSRWQVRRSFLFEGELKHKEVAPCNQLLWQIKIVRLASRWREKPWLSSNYPQRRWSPFLCYHPGRAGVGPCLL